MTVRIIIIIMLISSCCADLNFLSFITKFYDSNVKSLRNFFNLNEDDSDPSVFMYDNDVNVHEIDNSYWKNEIDNNYWMEYLRKDDDDDLYGVRSYDK